MFQMIKKNLKRLNFSELSYNNNYTIQHYTILGYIIQHTQNVIYDKTRNYVTIFRI